MVVSDPKIIIKIININTNTKKYKKTQKKITKLLGKDNNSIESSKDHKMVMNAKHKLTKSCGIEFIYNESDQCRQQSAS